MMNVLLALGLLDERGSPVPPIRLFNGLSSSAYVRPYPPFLRGSSALSVLAAGLPLGWTGGAYADVSPEVSDMKFGIIALTDCSSIVVAHEKGLFKKSGIQSTVAKGASWAAIRDSLANGDNQATHMLLGMPIASTMGLGGAPRKPMVVPFILNRNGQAITLPRR